MTMTMVAVVAAAALTLVTMMMTAATTRDHSPCVTLSRSRVMRKGLYPRRLRERCSKLELGR